MKHLELLSGALLAAILGAAPVLGVVSQWMVAQTGPGNRQIQIGVPAQAEPPEESTSPQAESELEAGVSLTRRALFKDAIPHLLAARGRVTNEYAASFDLALCYVGTAQFPQAIPILSELRKNGHDNSEVNNLLAQAYIGSGQATEAFEALRKAAAQAPGDSKAAYGVSTRDQGAQEVLH
jgi:predicted Zn-dependent protease